MSGLNQAPNVEWTVRDKNGDVSTWDCAHAAILMDIRRELQALNRLLGCPNFTGIPQTLHAIRQNTAKRKLAKRKRT